MLKTFLKFSKNYSLVKLLIAVKLLTAQSVIYATQYAYPATVGYVTAVAPLTMLNNGDTLDVFSGTFSAPGTLVQCTTDSAPGTYTVTIHHGATMNSTGVGLNFAYPFFVQIGGINLNVVNNGTLSTATNTPSESFIVYFNNLTSSGTISTMAIELTTGPFLITAGTVTVTSRIISVAGQPLTLSNAGAVNGSIDGTNFTGQSFPINLNGSGNISGGLSFINQYGNYNFDLSLNSTGRVLGTMTGGGNSSITIGNNGVAVTYTPSTTITGVSKYNIVNGTFTNTLNPLTGVDQSLITGASGIAILNNSMSGSGSIVNAGRIDNAATNALALTGPFTHTGILNVIQSLSLTNAMTMTAGSIVISSGKTLTMASGGSLNQSGGIISGAGSFANQTTTTLGGANTYSGGTVLSGGILSISADNNLGAVPGVVTAASLSFGGGALATTANITLSSNRGMTLNTGGGALKPAVSTTLTYNGIIAGGNALTISGAGTVVLGGVNTYSGGTVLSSGILSVAADNNLGAVPGVVTAASLSLGGGALVTTANITVHANRGMTLNVGGGALKPAASTTLTYNGIIAGANALTMSGAGILALGGTNTYTGPTNITSGTLSTTLANAIAFTSDLTLSNVAGVIFNLNNFNQTVGSLSGGGATGGNISLGSAILTVKQTTSGTFAGVISGSGGLVLSNLSTNTLTLSGTNTYTGPTSINAASLSIAVDNNLGQAPGVATAAALNFAGGALITSADLILNSNRGVALNVGGGALKPAVSTTLTYNGIIAGGNALTISGAGTVVLGGVNTYSGGTVLSSGILSVAVDNNLGAVPGGVTAASLIFGGGTLVTTANITVHANRGITLNADGILKPAVSTTLTYNGIITGANALSITGAGTVDLGGVNTYSGGTVLTSGVLSISTDNNLGQAPGMVTAASLNFGGGALATKADLILNPNRGITLNAGGILKPAVATTLTYNGIITGPNSLTISGAGKVILGGANDYSGGTVITSGTLEASGDNLPTAGAISVGAAGTFSLTSGNADVTGSFVNAGIANLAGTLSPASGSSNSNTININSGGKLNITSAFNNTGDIQNNANMAIAAAIVGAGTVHNNASGIITVSGKQALTVASVVNSGALNFSITNAGTYDQLTCAGCNITSGTVDITSAFASGSGTFTWDILRATNISTPTKLNVPNNSIFTSWSGAVVAITSPFVGKALRLTAEAQSFEDLAIPGINSEIATVFVAMASLPSLNSSQTALINLLSSSSSVAQFNDTLNKFVPNINLVSETVQLQNHIFSRAEARLAALQYGTSRPTGFVAGDLAPDTALWLGGFGNEAKQRDRVNTPGYNARATGFLLGVDSKWCKENVIGFAMGSSNAKIDEHSNENYYTNITGYHALFYGTNHVENNKFVDWLFTGAINRNRSARIASSGTTNLSGYANYRVLQSGAKFNFGKKYDFEDLLTFSWLGSIQYAFIHQPSYAETGSIAALNVTPTRNTNIMTVGTGVRMGFPTGYWRYLGSRELRAMVTYDAISTQQVTTVSFVAGSSDFTIANKPTRLAVKIGADFALDITRNLELVFNYDFEWRTRFTDHAGMIKLKYLF